MNSISSQTDAHSILAILNRQYPVRLDDIVLHRNMIGYVYIAGGGAKKYVLKLYRSFDTENALRSIGIIEYLREQDYPVVSIIPTRTGERHITFRTPRGPSAAILFDFVDGVEPVFDQELQPIARQMGRLHRIMDAYSEPLICRGKEFYVDRYIQILRELEYPADRIAVLEAFGSELWSRLEQLPPGFCHGDFHSGNMRKTADGRFILFDFDAASRTRSVIDVATACDRSNFNRFDEAANDRTLRAFERFYPGYCQERTMTDAEIRAIFDFIPVRHYEIIATITRCQGLQELSAAFLDEQYDWLMRWRDLLQKH